MKFNKFLILALALIVIGAWAVPKACATPVFFNYGSYQSADGDDQAKFQFTTPVKQLYTHEYWGLPVDVKFAVTARGTGFTDQASSPVDFDFEPRVWAETPLPMNLTGQVEAIHRSNGESGASSEGWNRVGGGVTHEGNHGKLYWQASGLAFWVADSESDEWSAIKTIGDVTSKFGIEGTGIVGYEGFGALVLDGSGEQALIGARLDVLDGDFQPFVSFNFGRGMTMGDATSYQRLWQFGSTVTF